MRCSSTQQVRRWPAVFVRLALFLLLSLSCATSPSNRKYVGAVFESESPAGVEESFPQLWEKWTVRLGMEAGGGLPWQFMNPFSTGGGRGVPGGEFPLQITATLMDTMLIEAGLRHYETMLTMTPDEGAEFRRAYFQRYEVGNHLLVWCQLQTFWAKLHLDLDRWIIFIEDDAVNQYEPVKILEEFQSPDRMTEWELPGFGTGERHQRWKVNQKTLMLLFPKRDFYRNPVLSQKVMFLKLVFQLSEDEKTKSQGIWVFRR